MGLLNTKGTAPAFEDETETAAQAPATEQAATPTKAVAVKPVNAVSTGMGQIDVLADMKDALRVDYNTLAQITAQQGNMVEREGKVNMGDTVVFDLLSFQDSYVVTPGDDKAPVETLRFSEDGITCTDGTPCLEHVDFLKHNGYPLAAMKKRTVVVGAIVSAAKTDKFNGQLMQFDLSPQSRVQFERYRANAAYAVKLGRYTKEQICHIKANAELASKGPNSFTLLKFEVAA